MTIYKVYIFFPLPPFLFHRLPASKLLCRIQYLLTANQPVLSEQMDTQNPATDLIINTEEEYDQFIRASMPMLLERASTYSKKILRETDDWTENVSHEKLALRLGYELVERFLLYARTEIPCRPTLLLDSYVAKYFSQPTSFVPNNKPGTALETFIDGLASKAVVSRDALIAQFTHFYALTPSQVIKLLGLAEEQSQRIYKNFTRWRRAGWNQTMKEIGLTLPQITNLEQQLESEPHIVSQTAKELLVQFQSHYRKSEPDHYPCQTKDQWEEMFMDGHGQDYRVWHLAMCFPCLSKVYSSTIEGELSEEPLKMNLHIQPGLISSKS